MAESKYYGLYQGVVTNINDPEKRGRIKIKCPEVLGGNVESAWCDPLVPVAYDNGGDFCIPAKEETVWVQFIAGDANKPVYMGGWWQKNMTPLGSNYSKIDQVRIISYADCTITMQGGKISINVGSGSGDLVIEDGTITVDGDLMVHGKVTAGELEINTEDGLGSATIAGDVSIKGDSELEGKLKVLDTTTLKATNVTTLKASGKGTFSKDVEVKGNVEVTGTLNVTDKTTLMEAEATTFKATEVTAETDVTAGGVSLKGHTHSCGEGGTGGAR